MSTIQTALDADRPVGPTIWVTWPIAALTSLPYAQKNVRDWRRINQRRKGAMIEKAPPQPLGERHVQLMQRIAIARDKDAFREVFSYFAPRVKSYLLRFNINGEQAEDLTQEIMVTVWRKAEQYDSAKAALSTWIFRIARNRFIDQSRKQKYPEVNADDHLSTLVAPEETDKPLEQHQAAVQVKAALDLLNTDQRTVIELSFFEELSHAEIATRLSLPLGTVKSRIRLAFKALRIELEDKS